MFTGIVEATGRIIRTGAEGKNLRLTVECPFTRELQPDQSVAHNGVCLTVEKISGDHYEVVAVDETLQRTNLGRLKPGDIINLERSMKLGDRIDGHLVQGHVDTVAMAESVEERQGSTVVRFTCAGKKSFIVEKGSVCIDGISLTVTEEDEKGFSVAIIPYTFEHTNLKGVSAGRLVNVEFDIIGKYVLSSTKYLAQSPMG